MLREPVSWKLECQWAQGSETQPVYLQHARLETSIKSGVLSQDIYQSDL